MQRTRAIYDVGLATGSAIMKLDYRITLAISSVVIVAALLFPPWKSSYDQNFIGFYFAFEDGVNLPYGAQLDYPRLTIEVFCIALVSLLIHLSLHVPVVWRAQAKVALIVSGLWRWLKYIWDFIWKYWLWIFAALAIVRVIAHSITRHGL